jgi:hypothetical protein
MERRKYESENRSARDPGWMIGFNLSLGKNRVNQTFARRGKKQENARPIATGDVAEGRLQA